MKEVVLVWREASGIPQGVFIINAVLIIQDIFADIDLILQVVLFYFAL